MSGITSYPVNELIFKLMRTMFGQSLNLLDLVAPAPTADTNIHTFAEFKQWINNSFNIKTDLNHSSYISKNSEVPILNIKVRTFKSIKLKKGNSFNYDTQSHNPPKLTTSLTKRLSIVYNDRNEIEEKEEALEHSALPTEEPHPSINRRLSFAGEIVVSRKSSYGGELGFQLRENSVRRSHSAQSAHSSVSVNGYQQINQYQLIRLLGKGAFADVYLAVDVYSEAKQKYAVKILCSKKIRKRLMFRKNSQMLEGPPSPPPDLEVEAGNDPFAELEHFKGKKQKKSKTSLADLFVRNQVAILKKMNHKYITKLYDVIVDNEKQKMYLVLEYCSGGFIGQQREKQSEWGPGPAIEERKAPYRKLLESECKRYTKQLALALDYIHNVAKIVHRDIKPQNILLSEFDEVKISDFGLGTHKIQGKKYAGTPLYMPPEAQPSQSPQLSAYHQPELPEGNHTAGDIWALGVTLLVLLSGRHPDFTSNKIDVGFELHNIKKETSEVCRDFLKRCLEIDPSKRIKAQELLEHGWLGGERVRLDQQVKKIVVSREEEEQVISERKNRKDGKGLGEPFHQDGKGLAQSRQLDKQQDVPGLGAKLPSRY